MIAGCVLYRYWTLDGEWSFGCGNGTSANHRWTLEEMIKGGKANGSKVLDAHTLTVSALDQKARSLLNL